jgi:predicted RNA-binding Zn ribbon-like protein
MSMLRECGNPECRWLFLDTSKNHTRRWCDMKICGNRMKARRFKAQHRA